jgi:hypothetical protein
MDFASIVDWFSQESMNAAEQTNEPKRRESRGLGGTTRRRRQSIPLRRRFHLPPNL